MTRLLSAEALKLRTTRTTWALALAALLITGGVTTAIATTTDATEPNPLATAVSAGGFGMTIALLLGILAVTTEFRHGTITASLLAVPTRHRILLAKLGVMTLVGLALGMVTCGVSVAVAATLLEAGDIATGADAGTYARIVGGGALGAALYGAIGVGIGTLARNQVGAVFGAMAWIYVIEQLLVAIPGLDDVVQRFGLVGLAAAASDTVVFDPDAELLAQGPALLVLAGWAAVLVGAGALALRRRDVH